MSHPFASPSSLRIEEVETALVLPQILRLRAARARHVSLALDMTPWLDRLDGRAMHWGVFRNAELVASARLCVQASLDDLPDAALFRPIDDAQGPVALMSHCVVHPGSRDQRLESALDDARIERARQLQLGAVLATTRSPRRLATLLARGFAALAPAVDGRNVLVLALPRDRAPVRLRVRSRR